jgi:hypothetical protein
MTSVWFSPAPSETTASRLSLDFGLRSADLFFRELVVPELGRVWFVRQISWAVAALALHKELQSGGPAPPKPTAISHGIEALACKLEYTRDREKRSKRILGTRAFGRDTNGRIWTFGRLHQASNYVRNTHRQAVTRAIQEAGERGEGGGLGFARGSRFDLFELEPVGRELANVFLDQRVGKGGTSLRNWLLGWLGDDRKRDGDAARKPDSLIRALSPEHPTEQERNLVRSRLLEVSTPNGEKRKRLAKAIRRPATLPDIDVAVINRLPEAGYAGQADEIVAARAFGAVLDRARDAVAKLTAEVEPARGGVRLATLTGDQDITRVFENLRSATKNYVDKATTAGVNEPTSRDFAKLVAAADDGEAIRLMVRCTGQVLGLADDSVVRGALFRVVDATDEDGGLEDGAASIEPDRTGRTFRIANFHSLLRDVDPPGAQ